MNYKKRRSDVFKDKHGKSIQFFRVPMEFQMAQATLSSAEINVYIFFMIQVGYQNKLVIQTTSEFIKMGTGIKNHSTITKAIHGLCEKGWIGNIYFQPSGGNKYTINLSPEVNPDLLRRIKEYGEKMSEKKKRSIENGESGKFQKKEIGE